MTEWTKECQQTNKMNGLLAIPTASTASFLYPNLNQGRAPDVVVAVFDFLLDEPFVSGLKKLRQRVADVLHLNLHHARRRETRFSAVIGRDDEAEGRDILKIQLLIGRDEAGGIYDERTGR